MQILGLWNEFALFLIGLVFVYVDEFLSEIYSNKHNHKNIQYGADKISWGVLVQQAILITNQHLLTY